MGIDYKDKIRKLLALAESPVEAEAKAALLKARELMAEHKLTVMDLGSAKKSAVKREVTSVTFNTRRDFWALELSNIIAPNYCCQAFSRTVKGKQTSTVGFIGLNDDFDVCVKVYNYAVDCIHSWIRQKVKKENLNAKSRRVVSDSFGFGFCAGLKAMFEEQNSNRDEWGLVLVVPREVQAEVDSMESKSISYTQQREQTAYDAGYQEGNNFDMGSRLAATNEGGTENV